MTANVLLITTAITTALLISAAAYAGGGMGGGGQEGMGSGGGGMMGSGGSGMMDSSPNFSTPRTSQQFGRTSTDHQNQMEREKLRDETREKRQDLSE